MAEQVNEIQKKEKIFVYTVCARIWIENHKWKMSFHFGWDILLSFFSTSLAVIVVFLLSLFVVIVLMFAVWVKCVSFAGFYNSNIPFKKLYKCTNQSYFFFSEKKQQRITETAWMTPSDNIVYVLCNFYSVCDTYAIWSVRVSHCRVLRKQISLEGG